MRKQEPNDKALAPATTLGAREQTDALVSLLAREILEQMPKEGAWDTTCPFCDEEGVGGVRHKPGCVIPIARNLLERSEASPSPQPQVAKGKEEALRECLVALAVLKITDKDQPYAEISPTLRNQILKAHDLALKALEPVEGQQKDLGER